MSHANNHATPSSTSGVTSVTTRTMPFQRPDGKSVSAFLASPDVVSGHKGAGAEHDASVPCVVVVQEWWGLNDQIRRVAMRLAQAGYVALVPDLYRGQSTVDAEEASHLMNALDFADAASQDIRGAVQHLKQHHRNVGIVGFCMGGALTWLALTHVPELEAGVAWYGYPPIDYINARAIKAPVMAHWAEQDSVFPIAAVNDLEARLRQAGVHYHGHRYPAMHAFANETAQGPSRAAFAQYDAAWTQIAWDRTLRFFGKHLG